MTYKKKLIEVALPLEAINKASAREKSIRHGHPSTLHLWWARRPLAAARAVIFAQMVDDPSAHPDLFPTVKKQDKERQRLFRIIEDLVLWENTTNESVLQKARDEIWASWRRTCAENADHPRAKELFDRYKLPAFHDPFAGGGALPLEAQRLGLEAYASDLNPVAVLICKAMIEIPPKFAGKEPVNPEWQNKTIEEKAMQRWSGTQGLADDIRYYGKWMRDEAEKRIGHLYPKIEITKEMAQEREDLKKYVGDKLTVIAWIWARTLKSPNPAFANIDVPLVSTFMLANKPGKEVYVEPVVKNGNYSFTVKVGKPKDIELAKNGTRIGRGTFSCILSGTPISGDYIKAEGRAHRISTRLMAIVAEGDNGRIYLSPNDLMESVSEQAKIDWQPEGDVPARLTGGTCVPYGLEHWGDLFTSRQLKALTTFTDLMQAMRDKIKNDALVMSLCKDNKSIHRVDFNVKDYCDAVSVYLAFAISKVADRNSSIATWASNREHASNTFKRQALPMTWDFSECNVFSESSGNFIGGLKSIYDVLNTFNCTIGGTSSIENATRQSISMDKIISTDPPYYDNIAYADLSDFFYIWLRQSLKSVYPDLFATLAVPKSDELVATPYRHGSKEAAERFFLNGMTNAMQRLSEQSHPAFPVTVYYAFKQSENDNADGAASTGWETFLDAVIKAGFAISGTWPMRTELERRMVGRGTNALASSIILVCRERTTNAPTATRRDFITALKTELPVALVHLQRGNIAPVDLAQAAIGPGMAVYTRYEKVLDAEGSPLTVRDALTIINQILDETLAEQEGDFDADTRFAVTWFEQAGFVEGEFGVADVLARAKNTSVPGLVDAGILSASRGKVKLFKPSELPDDWEPEKDKRLTVWEMVHHLIRVLESGGEPEAAKLVARLGTKAETARELCYRLYTLCERKKRAAEALSYNALVQSWPEISRLAADERKKETPQKPQGELFEND